MPDDYSLLPWNRVRGAVDLSIGELHLARIPIDIIRSDPDVFSTPDLTLSAPPRAQMESAGVSAAYIYSCPTAADMKGVTFIDGSIRYVRQKKLGHA